MNFHLQVPPADPQAHGHTVVSSSFDESSRSWVVYKATSPSGRVYVGVTKRQLANLDKGCGVVWKGRGRQFSDAHLRNKQEANKRIPDSERLPESVRRSDGVVFGSIAVAARDSGLSVSQVRIALKNGRPTKQGSTFTKGTGLIKSL